MQHSLWQPRAVYPQALARAIRNAIRASATAHAADAPTCLLRPAGATGPLSRRPADPRSGSPTQLETERSKPRRRKVAPPSLMRPVPSRFLPLGVAMAGLAASM